MKLDSTSLEKIKKTQLIKEKPQLGELKVKRVREMKRLNKENENESC